MSYQNFSINKSFARSARIDANHSIDVIENYIFHDTSQNTFQRLFESFESGQTAFTLTGPYGSGKSSLAIILDKLLCSEKSIRDLCSDKLSKGKKKQFKNILPDVTSDWVSVKLVGKREDCIAQIARSIDEEILQSKIKFPKDIKSITAPSSSAVLEKLSKMSEFLHKKDSGLILIIDEMGKFLEFAAQNDGDIYIFQEIAEKFSDLRKNHHHNVIFMNILHQSFEDYASRNQDTNLQIEWAKIQGRFENIIFNLGFEQGVDLIAGALKGCFSLSDDHPIHKQSFDIIRLIGQGRFKTRDNLNESLSKCYPMSPLATLLLGPIAKEKFGQNERSLFTFLSASEPHGFSNFIKNDFSNNQELEYSCSDLWDYIELNYDNIITSSNLAHAYNEVKECIRRSDQLDNDDALNLTKTLSLIELFGRKNGITASKKLLSLTFTENLNSTLKILEEKSIVIFRKSQNEYRLFEGSDIDINNEVEIQKNQINWDWNIIFNEIPTPNPVVPKRHYLNTGSLRWFEKRIVPVDHFDQFKNDISKFSLMDNCTGIFILFVPNAKDNQKTFLKKVKEIDKVNDGKIQVIYGSSNFIDGLSIINIALEIAALKRVSLYNEAIKHDRVARNEFQARLDLSEKKLSEILNGCFDYADWTYNDEKIKRTTLSSLSSQISDKIYKQTPRVSNELINRDQPSGIAVGGRAKLIEHMVNHAEDEDLSIVGNPPEKSFYLNIVKSSGMHVQSKSGWFFTKPHKDSSLLKLYQSLDEQLHGMKRLSITDIYNTWAQPPYGVKAGVMPILLMSFYLARVDEIALYEEEVFRPNIDQTFIEKFMFSPDLIFIQKIDLGKSQLSLINAMKDFSSKTFKKKINSDSVLEICKPLVNAAYQLHPFVRRSRSLDKIDKNAQSLRQALVTTKNPYELLFNDLPKVCLGKEFDLSQKIEKKEIDQFISILSQLWSQLDEAYEKMLNTMKSNLLTLFDYEMSSSLKKVQSRCNKLLNMDGITNTFSSRLLEGENDNETMEKVLTYVSEKPLENWTDPDFSNAKLKLIDHVNEFKRMERLVATYNKSDKQSSFSAFKDSYLVDILISEGENFQNLTKLLDIDKVQKERVNTIALNSISKLPKDMTKDEKIAVAIQILKNIGDDEKKQMSLFQEVASDEY